jgi:hypothetical protein
MFQMFQMYVTSVSYECCKSRSRCCICCNSYTRMLQVSIQNVSSISDVRCKCFICMLHMLQWLYIYVVSICFKCFIYFQMYVATGVSCFKRILLDETAGVTRCAFACRVCAFPRTSAILSKRGKWARAIPACMIRSGCRQSPRTCRKISGRKRGPHMYAREK